MFQHYLKVEIQMYLFSEHEQTLPRRLRSTNDKSPKYLL